MWPILGTLLLLIACLCIGLLLARLFRHDEPSIVIEDGDLAELDIRIADQIARGIGREKPE